MLMFLFTDPIAPPRNPTQPCTLTLHVRVEGSPLFLLRPQFDYRIAFVEYSSKIITEAPSTRSTSQSCELHVVLALMPQVTKVHIHTPCGSHVINFEIDLLAALASLKNS